jgi:hypothetical protein
LDPDIGRVVFLHPIHDDRNQPARQSDFDKKAAKCAEIIVERPDEIPESAGKAEIFA